MLPILLSALFLQRALTLSFSSDKDAPFDFSQALTKLREDSTFDLFHDKEHLSLVFNEVVRKGILPCDYQMTVLNFCVLWYFVSTFLVQMFALLYYRKFRDN